MPLHIINHSLTAARFSQIRCLGKLISHIDDNFKNEKPINKLNCHGIHIKVCCEKGSIYFFIYMYIRPVHIHSP